MKFAMIRSGRYRDSADCPDIYHFCFAETALAAASMVSATTVGCVMNRAWLAETLVILALMRSAIWISIARSNALSSVAITAQLGGTPGSMFELRAERRHVDRDLSVPHERNIGIANVMSKTSLELCRAYISKTILRGFDDEFRCGSKP